METGVASWSQLIVRINTRTTCPSILGQWNELHASGLNSTRTLEDAS